MINHGSPLGKGRFEAETGIKESDWSGRYWTKWGDAVVEAGYAPNKMQEAYSSEDILKTFISFIQELGHYPTVAEIKMKSRTDSDFPSHNTFNKLGSKSERARRVVEYCEKVSDLQGVVELCKPLASSAPTDEPIDNQLETFGFVYLLKSGKYFKIGRSVCAEKRKYEIQLQLPEELKMVHKIKTDDPVGIEAYWHGRFADKRKRGEWFDLTSEEINAFRRRKFM